MAITFKVDSTTGEGTFIRVLRDGRPFGKILDAVGLYRFYEGDHERLGGSAELQDADSSGSRRRSNRGTKAEADDHPGPG